MGAQFGRWNLDGRPTPTSLLDRIKSLLSVYGPGEESLYRDGGVDLIWNAFETTETHSGSQPLVLASGEVLLWDGRLDNGPELVGAMGSSAHLCDLEIVAAAWSCWQQGCLARLIGDWALSLWNPQDRCLHLAVDVLASRHLCYTVEPDRVQWSSVPGVLALLLERNLSLDEEYLAGWLASFPQAHLTAFREIRRVPPAALVTIRRGGCVVGRYWEFDGQTRIRYKTDAGYEEHFLEVFRQSIRRRLRATHPIMAELSGGMDSSSIVCVADQLTAASGHLPIDTVSYFDHHEPHWNEFPWFTKVETHRGKVGLHIDISAPLPQMAMEDPWFPVRPGASSKNSSLGEFMRQHGHRVLLSGIGGDEFLGGIPTPLPELEDLLARGNLLALCKSLLAWALVQRRPWIHLLGETATGLLRARGSAARNRVQSISWLHPSFAKRQRQALCGYEGRLRWLGPPPSFQENVVALEGVRRQLGCKDLIPGHPYETRYPFLDRDLLQFLFAIPRDQLVRPGIRRSLMRRALRGIVPEDILNRRRKAYVSRSLFVQAGTQYKVLSARECLKLGGLGIVNADRFLEELHCASHGKEVPIIALLRAVAAEQWLDRLDRFGVLRGWQARADGPISQPTIRDNQTHNQERFSLG